MYNLKYIPPPPPKCISSLIPKGLHRKKVTQSPKTAEVRKVRCFLKFLSLYNE